MQNVTFIFQGSANPYVYGTTDTVQLTVHLHFHAGFVWKKTQKVAALSMKVYDMGPILGLDDITSVRFVNIKLWKTATFETTRHIIYAARSLKRFGIQMPPSPAHKMNEVVEHLSVLSFTLSRHRAQRTLILLGLKYWRGMSQINHLVRQYSGPLLRL